MDLYCDAQAKAIKIILITRQQVQAEKLLNSDVIEMFGYSNALMVKKHSNIPPVPYFAQYFTNQMSFILVNL